MSANKSNDRRVGLFRSMWLAIRTSAKDFTEDHGTLMAAAISFYAILSLFPLLLLGVSVSAYILGSSENAFNRVTSYLGEFIPSQAGFVEGILHSLVQARGVIGVIGLAILLWTGSQFFVTLQGAMNVIWEAKERRGFVMLRLVGLGIVGLIGVLFLLSVGLSFVLTLIRHARLPLLSYQAGDIPYLFSALALLLSLLASTGMFFIIYRFTPSARVNTRAALYAAITASIIWQVAKWLYQIYLDHFGNFGAVYGSLGGVIMLVLWIYYSSMILVFCGEIAQEYQRWIEGGETEGQTTMK